MKITPAFPPPDLQLLALSPLGMDDNVQEGESELGKTFQYLASQIKDSTLADVFEDVSMLCGNGMLDYIYMGARKSAGKRLRIWLPNKIKRTWSDKRRLWSSSWDTFFDR